VRGVIASASSTAWLKSGRPGVGGDSGGIGADIVSNALAAIARERGQQRGLDLPDQTEAAKHQPGINLDQARPGANLTERARSGIDAAGANQREHAFDPN